MQRIFRSQSHGGIRRKKTCAHLFSNTTQLLYSPVSRSCVTQFRDVIHINRLAVGLGKTLPYYKTPSFNADLSTQHQRDVEGLAVWGSLRCGSAVLGTDAGPKLALYHLQIGR